MTMTALFQKNAFAAMEQRRAAWLRERNAFYDEDVRMVRQEFSGPGYHSKLSQGAWVHLTVPSLDYALGLIQSPDSRLHERACGIIAKVLTLQDQSSLSSTYGIWPWSLEEPLAMMSPPDWNWADFCGARLAQTLIHHRDRLPEALANDMGTALGHAGWSIFRRNMSIYYTNIALMGSGVTAMAGELLGEGRLLDYARERLSGLLRHTREHGDFTEYNSPNYTALVLEELERILYCVRDGEIRRVAEQLHGWAWKTISDYYHAGTDQWAGPQSRAYKDWFAQGMRAQFRDRLPDSIWRGKTPPAANSAQVPLVPPLPATAEAVERFSDLPAKERVLQRQFVRATDQNFAITGTTWFSPDACLGSVNLDSLWTQRRPVLGYWRTDGETPAVLRVRCLRDGQDCASFGLWTRQIENRMLAALTLFPNLGDFHLFMDRPANGRLECGDLRLRCQLAAEGANASDLGGGRYELRAGGHRAVVHALDGTWNGRPVVWQLGQEDGMVFLDAILQPGAMELNLVDGCDFRAALGLELLALDAPVASESPCWMDAEQSARWIPREGVSMEVPVRKHAPAYPTWFWKSNA